MPKYSVRLRVTAWTTVIVEADSEDEAAEEAERYTFGDFDIDDVSDTEAHDVLEVTDGN